MTDSAAQNAAQNPTAPNSKRRINWLRFFVNLLVCLAILGGAAYALFVINNTEPTAQKINSVRKSAALVDTLQVVRGDYSPKLLVLGTVEAAQQIRLSPQIGGQVAELSDQFAPGGMVRKGDLLVRIDSADFENALLISKSQLEQANAAMQIEKARQRAAKKELKLLDGAINESNRGLVLREPQVASIKAQVSSAKASVQRAELNLDRTKVFAPFDAQVLSRSVNTGSQVGSGDELGQLVGVQEYWVNAAVPTRHLRWIEFADSGQQYSMHNKNGSQSKKATESIRLDGATPAEEPKSGSRVVLRDPDAWGPDAERDARVTRMIGTLDQRTRLARVLISVPDPLGIENGAPPMIIDTLVETEIEGKLISDVVRLEREYVRDQDTVWLLKDEKLEIRSVDVVFRDAEFAYIRAGIEAGDEVVTTTLATVSDGVGLRKITPDAERDSSEGAGSE